MKFYAYAEYVQNWDQWRPGGYTRPQPIQEQFGPAGGVLFRKIAGEYDNEDEAWEAAYNLAREGAG